MKKQFKESLQSVVFTSKFVIENSSPIVRVVHHEDGAWEFWGKEVMTEREIMLISLGQIVKIDPSLFELADLPIAFSAVRRSKDNSWELIPRK